MFFRPGRSYLLLSFLLVITCCFTLSTSADNPSAGKTKKAVEAADAATKAVEAANKAASEAARDAILTDYPDTDAGKAARAADEAADAASSAAEDALKAAAEARKKACESGKVEDAKTADEAEKAAAEAEAKADATAAAADKADAKADPFGKGLQKKKRAAARRFRAAYRAAIAAICFARRCAQLMDESSDANKKKKEETIETIDGLNESVDRLLALGGARNSGKVETAQGLNKLTFDTLNGRVTTYLPDDLRAGDTISGTVVAEPKGSTAEERKANGDKLSEFKLNFAPQSLDSKYIVVLGPRIDSPAEAGPTNPNVGTFTVKLPDNFDYKIDLNAPRTETETVTITVSGMIWFINNQSTTPPSTEPPSPASPFRIPELGQQGRPLEIFGPFDGNASNTTLMFGPPRSTVLDFEKNTENVSGGFGLIRPLAESPRKIVFNAPTNVAGPIELYVKEGPAQAAATCQNIGLRLTAPKTDLLKGEKTTLTTEVFGLQGIKKPVPLTLEAEGVITMDGGMFQQLFIQPSQVGADGRYVTTRGITGVQAGGWSATSTVVTTPFNIVLRDPDPPQTIVLNSFTGDYVFCGAGIKLSGTGKIQRSGCSITLTHDAPDRRVFGRIDACTTVDNSRFFTFYSPGTNVDLIVTVTDTRPVRRTIYFNPLGKPAPPVQDVSAFATCP